MKDNVCEWCGGLYRSGDGDWGRNNSGRYAQRPGRFCSVACSRKMRELKNGRLNPERAALRRLQLRHRDEFRQLLADELEQRGLAG